MHRSATRTTSKSSTAAVAPRADVGAPQDLWAGDDDSVLEVGRVERRNKGSRENWAQNRREVSRKVRPAMPPATIAC